MNATPSPPANAPMQTYFFLARKRENPKGLCPIYCRITAPKARKDFSTGIFIEPKEWGEGWPLSNIRQTRNRLTSISDKIYTAIAECEREDILDPAEVISRYHGRRKATPKNRLTVIDIAEDLLTEEKPSTHICRKIRDVAKRFEAATGCTAAVDVLPETLRGFHNTAKKELAPSTLYRYEQFVKRIFKFGENRDYLYRSPFRGYKIPKPPPIDPLQLNSTELLMLRAHTFASKRLNYVKDLKLLQCYTGFAYGDVFLFSPATVVETDTGRFLKGNRAKPPHEAFYLPFLPEAQSIAEKYNYQFPVISNQKYNAYLKEVAEITGIEKELTTHVGRRTFGQLMLDIGYSDEAVAKMMGHRNFKMTHKHYARVGERRIENEVLKLTGS